MPQGGPGARGRPPYPAAEPSRRTARQGLSGARAAVRRVRHALTVHSSHGAGRGGRLYPGGEGDGERLVLQLRQLVPHRRRLPVPPRRRPLVIRVACCRRAGPHALTYLPGPRPGPPVTKTGKGAGLGRHCRGPRAGSAATLTARPGLRPYPARPCCPTTVPRLRLCPGRLCPGRLCARAASARAASARAAAASTNRARLARRYRPPPFTSRCAAWGGGGGRLCRR